MRLRVVLAAVAFMANATLPALSQEIIDEITGGHIVAFQDVVDDCGDIDGDGIADGVIGSPGQSLGVFSGADRSWIYRDITDPDGANYGVTVSGAGDFDGDGCPDFMTGTSLLGNRVVVFSGADGSIIVRLAGGFDIDGTSEELGRSIDEIGDVNGDGFDDIIAAGLFGIVHVYLGPDGRVLRDHFGPGIRPQVAGVGDIDGDGCPDYVTGFPSAALVVAHSGADGSELLRLVGDGGSYFGAAVAGAGDINGDGVPDLVVGAPGGFLPNVGRGQVRIFSGADGGELLGYDGPEGEEFGFGLYVDGGKDLNGDGAPDFVVAAPGDNTQTNGSRGAAYIYSGSTGALLWIARGPSELDDVFAIRIALIDDLNRDGFADLMVGSNADYDFFNAGRVWFYAGAAGDLVRVCDSSPNSTGGSATLIQAGPISSKNNELSFTVEGGVPGESAILIYGPQSVQLPAGDGVLCVGNPIGTVTSSSVGLIRLLPAQVFDSQGVSEHVIDFNDGPIAVGDTAWRAGTTWTVQAAYRDPAGPGGTGINFSDALRITFTP